MVTSIDLGRIYPKAFNGLGKEINVPILIKKGEYDVTTAMSGEYVDLVGGQNKYTVLFKYSSI